MNKIFDVSAGCYPFSIVCAVGARASEVIKYIEKNKKYKLNEKEKKILEMDETTDGRTVFLECHGGIILLKSLKSGRRMLLLAMYEAQHVAIRILDFVGVDLCFDSEEAYVYLTQYIFDQILRQGLNI